MSASRRFPLPHEPPARLTPAPTPPQPGQFKNGTEYQDLGSDHFDRRSKDAKAKRLTAQLAKLGFDVRITPLPAAA